MSADIVKTVRHCKTNNNPVTRLQLNHVHKNITVSWCTFFPELWLAFLYRRHDHVSTAGGGKSVEAAPDAMYRYYVQVFGTCSIQHIDNAPLIEILETLTKNVIPFNVNVCITNSGNRPNGNPKLLKHLHFT